MFGGECGMVRLFGKVYLPQEIKRTQMSGFTVRSGLLFNIKVYCEIAFCGVNR